MSATLSAPPETATSTVPSRQRSTGQAAASLFNRDDSESGIGGCVLAAEMEQAALGARALAILPLRPAFYQPLLDKYADHLLDSQRVSQQFRAREPGFRLFEKQIGVIAGAGMMNLELLVQLAGLLRGFGVFTS